MTSRRTALTTRVGKLATWYRTPAGLLSLILIAAVLVLVIAGQTRWALVVAVGWMGMILPHKLIRERQDWTDALLVTAAESRRLVDSIGAEVSSIYAEISDVPTVDEVKTWQASVEDAQSSTNKQILRELHDVDGRRSTLAELVDRLSSELSQLRVDLDERSTDQGEAIAFAKTSLAEVEKVLGDLRDRVPEQRIDSMLVTQEVQAVTALYEMLEPTLPLPPLGGWALSSDAALTLARLIVSEEPELIVETGSGSSTVVAALAVAKNGHGRVMALEHDIEFGRATRKLLRDRSLEEYATVVDAPLKTYRIGGEDYRWYDIPEGTMNVPIDLLLVDGPPGPTGPRARFPALPLLIDDLSTTAKILVDDAGRPDEIEIAQKWQDQFRLYRSEHTVTGDLVVLRRIVDEG